MSKVYVVLWDVRWEGAVIQNVFADEVVAREFARSLNLRYNGTPEPDDFQGQGAFVETWDIE